MKLIICKQLYECEEFKKDIKEKFNIEIELWESLTHYGIEFFDEDKDEDMKLIQSIISYINSKIVDSYKGYNNV